LIFQPQSYWPNPQIKRAISLQTWRPPIAIFGLKKSIKTMCNEKIMMEVLILIGRRLIVNHMIGDLIGALTTGPLTLFSICCIQTVDFVLC